MPKTDGKSAISARGPEIREGDLLSLLISQALGQQVSMAEVTVDAAGVAHKGLVIVVTGRQLDSIREFVMTANGLTKTDLRRRH